MAEKPKEEGLDIVYVSFSAEINQSTTERLLKVCCELAIKPTKTIYLLLSTTGGNVTNGINIYNLLRSLPCKIITHNVGAVDSIGNVIFLAGDERYANANTTFMFHGVAIGINNLNLNVRKMRESLESLEADERRIAQVIFDRAEFDDVGDVEKLFLKAATKQPDFAKEHGIINDVREADVPKGAPIIQLVFQR